MKKSPLAPFVLLAAFILLVNPLVSLAGFNAQVSLPAGQAAVLLEKLTPEERVGQLFLVTFNGTQTGPETQIYDLITNHFVGGVVLLAANDNITDTQKPLNQIVSITRQLQTNQWNASQVSRTNPTTGAKYTPAFIPLFIALPQEGDGYPYDQVLNGMTPLPNEMALGATWNPDLAVQVGKVLGKELSTLGVNMLFGPSLDILEEPHTTGANDLGTRTFGGDPFWVGKMGSAYIQGVHIGSGGRVAVVAKHFPGYGGSDRLPEEEVATVRKSLELLKSFELGPFFAVTGNATTPESTADALLASHIRYQGFQGNIRATTRPVSLDPEAFSKLMALPPLETWRKNGGVMISDNLGGRAVRGYYEMTSQTFDAIRVARNAFLAGNDLLYMADFSSGDLDSYTSAVHTLDFFTQKYREDSAFAQQVDKSVLRILTLKYRLYQNFMLDPILAKEDEITEVGNSGQVTFDVARQAATLISPSQSDLDEIAPDPPDRNDRLVFITDTRLAQQCNQCPSQQILDVKALEGVVLRRYGPQTGGQVTPTYLSSYSLAELDQMLQGSAGAASKLERDLLRANWVVFTMLNSNPNVPSFPTLNRFLAERPKLFQQKRLIVFAFNAPYYLDATNISKLTAYYGLYSKMPQFVDIAAYLLFRELRPSGSLPVSVPGIGYDLNTAMFPDPAQEIHLELDLPEPVSPEQTTTATPELQPTPEFRIGEKIPVRTSIILDHNGHPVQDGTQVEFILSAGGEATAPRQLETTLNGVARTTFQITGPGLLEIRAESEPAKQSNVLTFNISSPGIEIVLPTQTEQPTQTPSPTATPTPTLTPTPIPPVQEPKRPQVGDWVVALLVTVGIAWSSYQLAVLLGQVRWGLRGGFLALIGGLLAYSYLALQFPGSEKILAISVSRGVLLATLVGCGLGLIVAWLWRVIHFASKERRKINGGV